MRVIKFGGSSVAHPDRIKHIGQLLLARHQKQDQVAVVFSAFGGVTDQLLEMASLAAKGDETFKKPLAEFKIRHQTAARELLDTQRFQDLLGTLNQHNEDLSNLLTGIFLTREQTPRAMDYVVSFGERNSSLIISSYFASIGLPVEYLDARNLVQTDRSFGNAKVDFEVTNEKIKSYFETITDKIAIITGFISSAKGGLTTTLGRGGSDYTAAIFGAALDAEAIEIWTDVNGVLTADPRKVKKAFSIPTMTYAEAMELSHFGAKVIYPPTLQPALQKGIPLYIKNTFEPEHLGTFISTTGSPTNRPVQGISSIGQISLLTLQGSGLFGVPGVAAKLFSALADAAVNIILITQGSSEHSITFAVQPADTKKALTAVGKAFEYEMKFGLVDPLRAEQELSVVAIVGENMRFRPGIAGTMFKALGANGINCVAIAQGSSELNVSVVIPKPDETKALNALHQAFFLSDTKELNLFLVGTGLVGKTFLRQLQEKADSLKKQRRIEIKVVGLSNSRKMIFNENGLDISTWNDLLDQSAMKADVSAFVETMKMMNLPNAIFIDNTSSQAVADKYLSILDESIAISSPNKIAASSAFKTYQALKDVARLRGVSFGFETNVGAGLPVITTLNDLLDSGDEIIAIEGVLSGTLSYIFNHFDGTKPFHEVVKTAQDLGLTEPDPRDDLNGLDVSRKLLILARESGLQIEQADITINPILTEAALNAPSVEAFYQTLVDTDAHYTKLINDANQAGQKLRMVASLRDGQAQISLKAYGSDHAFYQLSGSDNMIVFTTRRYHERPLVIRGPGAGAEVTAAGIFAEILRIGAGMGNQH
jgi:bifunctional aspartokinase / homoserine dehydrogenase 1